MKYPVLRHLVLSLLISLSILYVRAEDQTSSQPSSTIYYDSILKIDENKADEIIDILTDSGIIVLGRRGDLLLTYIPEGIDVNEKYFFQSDFESAIKTTNTSSQSSPKKKRAGESKEILKKLRRSKNVATMDVARSLMNADKILNGSSGYGMFDGTGVVVGLCDIGFDAHHINFLSEDGKTLRIKRAVQYIDSEARRLVMNTPEEILAWHTDNPYNFHATHTSGIMTGGYKKSGFYGMAPGADIVVTTSELTDVAILSGVEDIIEYAQSVGKPAVVNISLGSYTGPHDGTSRFCRYLDRCAEDAIICLSSGNQADPNYPCHVARTFTADKNTMKTKILATDWVHFQIHGSSDFYSDSSKPFAINLFVQHIWNSINDYNFMTESIDFSQMDPNNLQEYVLTSNPEAADNSNWHYSEEFAKYFTGEIYLLPEYEEVKGRFHLQIFYDCFTEEWANSSSPWAAYGIGALFTGEAGQRIEGFADASATIFGRDRVDTTPDVNISTSNLATGFNTISVGMYSTREGVALLSGSYWGGDIPFTVHNASSYGTLPDGRITPMTVAPGGPIVSSISGAYINQASDHGASLISYSTLPQYDQDYDQSLNEDVTSGFIAPTIDNDNLLYDPESTHSWGPYSGTSMASPYVAGALATWLQADPTLTASEVQNIIKKTNDAENFTLASNPRHGEGYFRPYDGFLEVINKIATTTEEVLGKSIFTNLTSEGFIIYNPDAREVECSFLTMDGRILKCCPTAADSTIFISKSELPSGISIAYIRAKGTSPLAVKIINL